MAVNLFQYSYLEPEIVVPPGHITAIHDAMNRRRSEQFTTPTIVRGGGSGVRICMMQWISRQLGNEDFSPDIQPPGVAEHMSRLIVTCNDGMCGKMTTELCGNCAEALRAVAERVKDTQCYVERDGWSWAYEALTNQEWGIPRYTVNGEFLYARMAEGFRQRRDGAPAVAGPPESAPLSVIITTPQGEMEVYVPHAQTINAHSALQYASGSLGRILREKLSGPEMAEATGRAVEAWREMIGVDQPAKVIPADEIAQAFSRYLDELEKRREQKALMPGKESAQEFELAMV
jgi:hypothetical protein